MKTPYADKPYVVRLQDGLDHFLQVFVNQHTWQVMSDRHFPISGIDS
ncbi:hypothetical protein [Nostoc sp.]